MDDSFEKLLTKDAEVLYSYTFLDEKTVSNYFQILVEEIAWRQEKIRIFGKEIDQPRLVAWYGDKGKVYTYSGLRLEPQPWTETLQHLRALVLKVTGVEFNSVLLNLYRDGKDSMGWHSDDEPELGADPVIASVSLGAVRNFRFRHKYDKQQGKLTIPLANGSLLLMRGKTQHFWQHCLPKTQRTVEPRINLTFRKIL